MSDEQHALLGSQNVILMLDGDEPGRAAQAELTVRLAATRFVRTVNLPDGKQPDMLTTAELAAILTPYSGRGAFVSINFEVDSCKVRGFAWWCRRDQKSISARSISPIVLPIWVCFRNRARRSAKASSCKRMSRV